MAKGQGPVGQHLPVAATTSPRHNIEVQYKTSSITFSHTLGKGSGKQANEAIPIEVPVLTNTKALRANDELLILREPTAKKHIAERPLSLSLQDGSKKRR